MASLQHPLRSLRKIPGNITKPCLRNYCSIVSKRKMLSDKWHIIHTNTTLVSSGLQAGHAGRGRGAAGRGANSRGPQFGAAGGQEGAAGWGRGRPGGRLAPEARQVAAQSASRSGRSLPAAKTRALWAASLAHFPAGEGQGLGRGSICFQSGQGITAVSRNRVLSCSFVV